MSRPALVPLGLVVSAAVILLFAWGGVSPLGVMDKLFLTVEGSGLLLAALALRDMEFPSDGLASVGFGVFAVAEVFHLVVSLGMPIVPLVGFVVYVVGAVALGVGAVQWWRLAADSTRAVMTMRIGLLIVGASYLYYVVLGFLGPSGSMPVTLLSLVGSVAAGVTAWAWDPGAPGSIGAGHPSTPHAA